MATLDYRGPDSPTKESEPPLRGTQATAVGLLLFCLVILNSVLLAIAHRDGSYGAVGIAIAIGPACNAALGFVFLLCVPIVRRAAGRVALYGFSCIMLPVISSAIVWAIIGMMDLHGS